MDGLCADPRVAHIDDAQIDPRMAALAHFVVVGGGVIIVIAAT
jgi:hypothetical protein